MKRYCRFSPEGLWNFAGGNAPGTEPQTSSTLKGGWNSVSTFPLPLQGRELSAHLFRGRCPRLSSDGPPGRSAFRSAPLRALRDSALKHRARTFAAGPVSSPPEYFSLL